MRCEQNMSAQTQERCWHLVSAGASLIVERLFAKIQI